MLPEIGSRWYWAGRHYTIAGHATRDGEPAVTLKNARTGKLVRVPVIWRLMERSALPGARA